MRRLLLALMVVAFERVKRTEDHIDLAPAERTPWEGTYAASEFFVTSHSIPISRSTDMMTSRKALVCGAGGFIGSHMVTRLRAEGYWVRGADLKYPDVSPSQAHEFVIADLRHHESWDAILDGGMDEVYQFAADMGGAGYIFTGANDAHVMHNSALINLHLADLGVQRKVKKVFYSSSACIYPANNQEDKDNPRCAEETAYPAAPDSEYGWE